MNSQPLRVLIVEDSPHDAQLLLHELRRTEFTLEWKIVDNEADYLAQLDRAPDVILSDYSLPQFDALRALELLRERELNIPLIIISGTIGEDVAVNAMRLGASDYLLKDRLGRLGQAIERVLEQRRLRVEKARAATVLAEIQERTRRILDTASDGFVAMDEEGRIIDWNAQAEATFGWSRREAIGRSMADTILPERYRQAHRDGVQRFRDTGTGRILGRRIEIEALHREGHEFPVELIIWAIRLKGSHTFSAFVRDITQRRRAEEVLRERSRLAALSADIGVALNRGGLLGEMLEACTASMVRNLDAAFARIWTLDPVEDVLVLQASSGMYTHLDGPHSRVPVGRFKIGLIAQERVPHLTNDVMADERVGDRDWAQRERMVAFAGYPLLVEDRLVGVMAMFARHRLTEATLEAMAAVANQIALGIERKRSEAELRQANQRLQLLVQASPLAIIALDRSGLVLQWNPAATQMFGFEETEVLGRRPPFIAAEQQAAFQQLLEGELRGERHAGVELARLHKNGKPVEVALWSAPLQGAAGKIVGTLEMFADVAERKRLQAQFHQSQKMEAIGTLAGGVAHDFNNLLTVITGYAELLLSQLPAEGRSREHVRQIGQASERAAALTRQLLAFSRKQVVEPKVLSLNAVVSDLEKMLGRLIGEDVRLTTVLDPAAGRVRMDPGQMEQIVLNLVVNSRDAMPQGGALTLETANVELDRQVEPDVEPGRYVLLAVSDTGCGIDAETLSHIFEPFFTTKGLGKGTGLGLATVYGIVQQGGGHIAVASEPGRGTTFRIYLPRVEEPAATTERPAGAAATLSGKETVILAEDEDGLRTLTRHVLQSCGYTVLEATGGSEALQLCQNHAGPIELLVTDVVMPEMSGRQLAERLQAARPGIKVLYLSGYTEDAMLRHGVQRAEAAFLQKPFTPGALARKVREVLD
ncbi:MAG TPA: PAS domain S-box protein [Candidatus Polarisedimenticolaceae bacterium]|nr:PAS domain S-box protein [Candidatus Polarisedimenticolaceae bacterium]